MAPARRLNGDFISNCRIYHRQPPAPYPLVAQSLSNAPQRTLMATLSWSSSGPRGALDLRYRLAQGLLEGLILHAEFAYGPTSIE